MSERTTTVISNEQRPSADLLRDYRQKIGRFPLLEQQDEVELAQTIEAGKVAQQRLAEDVDGCTAEEIKELERQFSEGREAHNLLVNSNLRIVITFAKRYVNRRVELADLIQEGNVGLMKAADKFDYRKGFRFSTYAGWWIDQAIRAAIPNLNRAIRVPADVDSEIGNMEWSQQLLSVDLGREPTDDELAQELDIAAARVADLKRFRQDPISLNTPFTEDSSIEFGDTLSDATLESPEQKAELAMQRQDIEWLLTQLPPEQAAVIRRRYGLGDFERMTIDQASEDLDITPAIVKRLTKLALQTLSEDRLKAVVADYIYDRKTA